MCTPSTRPAPAVGILLADHLYQALRLAHDQSPSVAAVGVLLGHHVESGLAGRLLGKSGEGHLRMAVDAPRHLGVVDRDHRISQDLIDDHDGLGETDVGQGGSVDQVAGREHPGFSGLHVLVDLDEASRIDAHLGAFQPQIGPTAAAGPPTRRQRRRSTPRRPRS